MKGKYFTKNYADLMRQLSETELGKTIISSVGDIDFETATDIDEEELIQVLLEDTLEKLKELNDLYGALAVMLGMPSYFIGHAVAITKWFDAHPEYEHVESLLDSESMESAVAKLINEALGGEK